MRYISQIFNSMDDLSDSYDYNCGTNSFWWIKQKHPYSNRSICHTYSCNFGTLMYDCSHYQVSKTTKVSSARNLSILLAIHLFFTLIWREHLYDELPCTHESEENRKCSVTSYSSGSVLIVAETAPLVEDTDNHIHVYAELEQPPLPIPQR